MSLDHSAADLALVQRALDKKVVRRGQVLELQCLDAVCGNVFNATTEMKWARVTNVYGDLLALHAPRIGFTLYPLQMIQKRLEDHRKCNVPQLYSGFVYDLDLRRS